MGTQEDLKKVNIKLYDHLPIVSAWLPFTAFILSGLILLPVQLGASWRILAPETVFWANFAVLWYWFLALFVNLGFKRFLVLVAAIGTLVGVPVAIDLTSGGNVVRWIFDQLGVTYPLMNASAYIILAVGFFLPQIIWDLVWSRMQTRVVVTAGELKVLRVGQKEDTTELIGLKTSHEPIDYLEVALGGYGTFGISLRSGKEIFMMRRIFGLYRVWWCFWIPGKKKRIEELIAGTNVNTSDDRKARVDAIDTDDTFEDGEKDEAGDDDDHGHAFDREGGTGEDTRREIS